MTDISASRGNVPLDEAQADLPRLLDEIARTGEAIVITKDGRAAAVLLSPEEFDALQTAVRRNAGAIAGLADIADGRFIDGKVVEEWLSTWGTPDEKEAPGLQAS